jgi:DNA-binding response OmpR family regulator
MGARILIVEDERKVAHALRRGLETERFEVAVEQTGDGGLRRATAERFDLILLDRLLPGLDGLEVLRSAKARGLRAPVVMLTARDSVGDRVAGLDAGADDYVVKPFAFAELLARMRVLLRRGREADAATRLTAADVAMDLVRREATRDGRPLPLTAKEFDLLALLLRHAGHLVSRDMIAAACWHGWERTRSLDNVIEVHIGNLRKKVDADVRDRLIHTERGVGYKLVAPERSSWQRP